MPVETVCIIPDMQVPQQDDKAIAVALDIIRYIKPTKAIFLGDVIAADSVSKYDKATWKEAEIKLSDEVDATNVVLDRFDNVFKLTKTKEIYYLEGNHEQRILKWAIKNAAMLGANFDGLRVQSLLRLDQRKYRYIYRQDQPLRFGKANFRHGLYLNQYHAGKTVSNTGHNTYYGDTHDHQVYTAMHDEGDEPRMAMSMGCLCNYNQSYMEGRPNHWIKGMGVVYFSDNIHSPYFIPIVNNQAIWNGKVFKV
jgi:hypothetical protein